jgi:predicted kinase
MATIHFMHGFIGYGKSTFARKLAEKLGCKRISMDDVYAELHNGRTAINLSQEERAELLEITWGRIADEVRAGRDVIFDSGAWTRKNRDSNRARAKALGAQHKHYSIECTPEIAWERVLKRNAEKSIENMYPKSHFDEKFQFFQPMQDDEEFELIPCDNN